MEQHGFAPQSKNPSQLEALSRHCILALRSNLARHIKSIDHRNFCIRITDSHLLQWFLQIGRINGVKTFAKSTSDRFSRWLDGRSLHAPS